MKYEEVIRILGHIELCGYREQEESCSNAGRLLQHLS